MVNLEKQLPQKESGLILQVDGNGDVTVSWVVNNRGAVVVTTMQQ